MLVRLVTALRAPVAIALLRVGQMLLALFAIRVTFDVLPPPAFVVFNFVLLAVALASAINNGFYVKLWFQSIRDARSGIAPNAALLGLLALAIVAIVFWSPQAASLSLFGAVGVFLYLQFRFVERMAVVALFSAGRPKMSYVILYATALFEISAAWISAFAEPETRLAIRLVGPAIAGGLLGLLTIRSLIDNRPTVAPDLAVERKALPVIVYLSCMTLAISLERLAGQWLQVGNAGFETYLLAHAYALAFVGLVGAVIDWARPAIISTRGRLITAERKTLGLIGMGGVAAAACYPVLTWLSVLPGAFGATYWIVLIGGSVAAGVAALLQIRFVAEARFSLVILAWSVCIAVRLIWLWSGQDAVASASWSYLVGNVIVAAILACGYFMLDLRGARTNA